MRTKEEIMDSMERYNADKMILIEVLLDMRDLLSATEK